MAALAIREFTDSHPRKAMARRYSRPVLIPPLRHRETMFVLPPISGPQQRRVRRRSKINAELTETPPRDRFTSLHPGAADPRSFTAYAAIYMGRRIDEGLQAEVLRGYDCYLRNHLLPAFGPFALDSITYDQISDWFDALAADSPAAANSSLRLLSSMIRRAAKWGYLPIEKEFLLRDIHPLRRPRRARFVLTLEKLRALGIEMTRQGHIYPNPVDIFGLLLFTGIKFNEAIKLEWSQIDNETLTFTRRGKGMLVKVPIGEAASKILRRRALTRQSRFVFPSPRNPNKPHSNVAHAWYAIRAAAKLPKRMQPSDLAYSYQFHAEQLGESGYVIRRLAGQIGFDSWRQTKWASDSEALRASELIATHISSLMGPFKKRR